MASPNTTALWSMLKAIHEHDAELVRWLETGGQARVDAFTPLASWTKVLDACTDFMTSGER